MVFSGSMPRSWIAGLNGSFGLPWWIRCKELACNAETWVRSLGWENPLEKEMATNSGILAWKIPWTEKHGGLEFMESQRVEHS